MAVSFYTLFTLATTNVMLLPCSFEEKISKRGRVLEGFILSIIVLTIGFYNIAIFQCYLKDVNNIDFQKYKFVQELW